MAAYLIAHVDVNNGDEYAKYAVQTVEIAKTFGGSFLVKGGQSEYLEGGGPTRHVIVEFPDMAAAKRFYHSDAYQAILPIALKNSERNLMLVEGV